MYKGEGREIQIKIYSGDANFEMMTINYVIGWSRYWRVNYKIQL